MFRNAKSLMSAAVGLLALTAAASAQVVPVPLIMWKYNQPWTKPWSAHASVVRDCQGQPVSFSTVAVDDWLCTKTGPIRRIDWWGTSPQPNQVPNRQFVIAIYSEVQCLPSQLLYRTCVLATNVLESIDCRDRRVYRFTANMPTGAAGWSQTAGTKYWLQISEADNAGMPMSSPTPGAIDFQWSAHRPIKNCPARKRAIGGPWMLCLDPCDQIEEDLAFRLYSTAIIAHVNVPGTLRPAGNPTPFVLELRRPSDGELTNRIPVMADVGGDGELHMCGSDGEEILEGDYRVSLSGHGFKPLDLGVHTFEDDSLVDLGGITVAAGDVNGDGIVSFADITMLLANYGM